MQSLIFLLRTEGTENVEKHVHIAYRVAMPIPSVLDLFTKLKCPNVCCLLSLLSVTSQSEYV